MKTFVSKSLEDTRKIASEWLKNLSNTEAASSEATLVGLSGHLGAGKTAFVKQAALELGIDEEVTSPTFIIMKIYEIQNEKWRRLIHIDAYRLEKREELEALNWESLIADPHNLILVEWPENVGLETRIRFEIRDSKHSISMN